MDMRFWTRDRPEPEAACTPLAAREGSFSRGGEVVDQKPASTAGQAGAAGQNASTAVADAGSNLQQQSVRR